MSGTVSEWKYLHPQELWEWGKKINKGKRSRATEVKHRQRRVVKREAHVPRINRWRKHLSHQAPSPCSEELDRGLPLLDLIFSRIAVPPSVKSAELLSRVAY